MCSCNEMSNCIYAPLSGYTSRYMCVKEENIKREIIKQTKNEIEALMSKIETTGEDEEIVHDLQDRILNELNVCDMKSAINSYHEDAKANIAARNQNLLNCLLRDNTDANDRMNTVYEFVEHTNYAIIRFNTLFPNEEKVPLQELRIKNDRMYVFKKGTEEMHPDFDRLEGECFG